MAAGDVSDIDLPAAQGDQPQGQAADDGQPTPSPQKNEGLQKRIDELVAAQHAWQRRAEEAQSQNQQLLAALVTRQTQQTQPMVDPVLADIDPGDAQKVRAIVAPLVKQIEEQQKQLAGMLYRGRARDVARSDDPRVADLAEKLAADWHSRGNTGWTPEDAAVYARGLLAEQERVKAAQARDEQGRFNKAAESVITNQTPPVPAYMAKRPKNFDSLPLDQQLAILERDIGDIPF